MNPEIDEDGNKIWYNKKEEYHRLDGPAIEFFSGTRFWCINGELHRDDGPAVEYFDGAKSWYYHGKRIYCSTQEEFERIIKLRMFW